MPRFPRTPSRLHAPLPNLADAAWSQATVDVTATLRERDTMLAALRLWQTVMLRQGGAITWSSAADDAAPVMQLPGATQAINLVEIAEDRAEALAASEIDALCERLNYLG